MPPRFFVDTAAQWAQNALSEGDRTHMLRALRLRPGETVVLCDGQGRERLCRLDEAFELQVLSERDSESELRCRVRLYPSLAKGERFEWLLQKAVELGAVSITPVLSRRCIAARPEERKLERWRKIIREAAAQSGRGVLPALHPPLTLDEALHAAGGGGLLCYERERTRSLRDILDGAPAELSVFTGPEGGYDEDEVARAESAGLQPVSLGARILRCETAPLYVLSVVAHALG